jgi:hypothetical protein
MAFRVRLFGYRGIVQAPKVLPRQLATDSVGMLVEPYEWAQNLLTTGAVAVSSVAQPIPDQTKLIRIEVDDGNTIRYEINPPGRTTAASTNSPRLSGIDHFPFEPGWTVSIIEGP